MSCAELIGLILGSVEGTLLDVVRMGFLHSSRARGRVPTSLKAASEVRFVGHTGEDGATLLHFEVPTFGSVASELFQLRRIRTYQHVLSRGIARITMPDTVAERRGHIDTDVVNAASELYAVTPTARRVRVTGRLDVMGASQGVLKLDVRPGDVVTALWEGEKAVETLRERSSTISSSYWMNPFFPGIAFDGNRFVRTGVTASAVQLLRVNQNQE